MSDVQGMIGGAMQRLSNLTQQGGSRHMCYLVLFIVFVFILVYFIISRSAGTPPAET
jgi:blocked-early-in-transport protein 1